MIHSKLYISQVDKAIEAEEFEAARRLLFKLLSFPEFSREVYERVAYCLRMLGKYEGANLFENALAYPENSLSFYQIGVELYNQGYYNAALGPLYISTNIESNFLEADIQMGLALFKEGLFGDAENYLERSVLLRNPLIPYILGVISLFKRDLERSDFYISDLKTLTNEGADNELQFYNMLDSMRNRYLLAEPLDLRDWHFVQYGKILIRHSFEDINYPDNRYESGRILNEEFNFHQVGFITKALIEILKQLVGNAVIVVLSKSMQPIANVVSKKLNMRITSLDDVINKNEPFLLLGESNKDFLVYLNDLAQNQNAHLFSFSIDWSKDAPIIPDITGYMAKNVRLPWDTELEEVNEITNAVLESTENVDENKISDIIRYLEIRKDLLDVGVNLTLPRRTFGIESPIIEVQE